MEMSIGRLSQRVGKSVNTLRFWSDRDPLSDRRGANGYRYFGPETIDRIAFIRRAQALGFRLEEIRGILALRERGVSPCNEVRDELQRHLDGVRTRIARLQGLAAELEERPIWAEEHPDPAYEGEGCVYVEPGERRSGTP